MTLNTPLTAAQLLACGQLGDIVRFSDGEPRPPERFKRKLADWKNKNDFGTLAEIDPAKTNLAAFKLHMGDLGSAGTIVMRMYRSFSAGSAGTFTIERHAEPGTILCCRQYAARPPELDAVHKTRDAAEQWLSRNHGGVLLLVNADGTREAIAGQLQKAA